MTRLYMESRSVLTAELAEAARNMYKVAEMLVEECEKGGDRE